MDLTHPSPNKKARPSGVAVTVICLHATAGKTDAGDVSWITSPKSGISYHATIGRDGECYTHVALSDQAYHAGESEWRGRKFVNQFSLGLAFSNRHDHTEPLTAQQIAVGKAMIQAWATRFPTITDVVTHAMVSPGRKTDPDQCPNFYLPEFAEALAEVRG